MKKYNLLLKDEHRTKAFKEMQKVGLTSLGAFFRMMIIQFPFRDGKQWSDDDMMRFAKGYSDKIADEPFVDEPEDARLKNALEKFKTSI
jgi:hypothetical protein